MRMPNNENNSNYLRLNAPSPSVPQQGEPFNISPPAGDLGDELSCYEEYTPLPSLQVHEKGHGEPCFFLLKLYRSPKRTEIIAYRKNMQFQYYFLLLIYYLY